MTRSHHPLARLSIKEYPALDIPSQQHRGKTAKKKFMKGIPRSSDELPRIDSRYFSSGFISSIFRFHGQTRKSVVHPGTQFPTLKYEAVGFHIPRLAHHSDSIKSCATPVFICGYPGAENAWRFLLDRRDTL